MKTYIKHHFAAIIMLLVLAATQAFAAETKTVLWENNSPNGEKFSKIQSIDFNHQWIEAEIDLSKCGTSVTLQNIMSFGNDIAQWSTAGKYNLHLYYTASTKQLEIDYLANGGGREQTLVTLSSTTLKLKLSSEGLAVNGVVKKNASTLSNLLALNSISIGSQQGDNRSYATYKSVSIVTSETTGGTTKPSTTPFTAPVYGSTYFICPADYPTRCFTVTTSKNDEQITVTTKSDSNNGQKWITKKGNYSTMYPWHIVNVMSSKALDMAGNNTKVMPLQWTSENEYNGGQANVNQEWKFEEVDATNHTYKIYAYTQNNTYYLTYDGTNGGKLGRTTDSSSATAFGFISTNGSAGGGTTSGGGTGGGSTTSPNHGSFSVSWISDQSKGERP